MVATDVIRLAHVPPAGVQFNEVQVPGHTFKLLPIDPMVGRGLTVTTDVVVQKVDKSV